MTFWNTLSIYNLCAKYNLSHLLHKCVTQQKTQLLYYNINVIFIKEISYLGSCVLQDENTTSRRGGTTTIWDSGVGGLSSTSNFTSQLEGESV